MTDSDGESDRGEREAGSETVDPGLFGGDDPVPQPVEPGSPSLENVAFVLLGVASTLALLVHLASLLG